MAKVRYLSFRTIGAPLLAVSCSSQTANKIDSVESTVIYGTDDRTEYLNVTDARLKRLADAVGTLKVTSEIHCSGGNCSLDLVQIGGTLPPAPPQWSTAPNDETLPLCTGVRFRNQMAAGGCTAFLVAPDRVMTAAHCFGASPPSCTGWSVVFGFYADVSGNAPTSVPSSNVYTCTGVVGQNDATADWAVFTVDRVVTGRVPMIVRYSGAPPHTELAAMGYPLGIPLKVAQGAFFKDDNPADMRFLTSADIFPGNSGGPVVNVGTAVAEGISNNGPIHFNAVSDGSGGSCAAENVCDPDTGCCFSDANYPSCPAPSWVSYSRTSFAATSARVPLHSALSMTVLGVAG